MRLFVVFCLIFSAFMVQAQDVTKDNCNDIRRIYKICSDQTKIFEQASAEALAKQQLIVVTFGADWCPWCHSLNTLFSRQDFIQKMNGIFKFVDIGVYQPESSDEVPTGMTLLKDLLVKNKKDISVFSGVPLLVVVDPTTQKAVFIDTVDLEDNSNGEGHDSAKVLNALMIAAKSLVP